MAAVTELEFVDVALQAAQGAMLLGVPILTAANPVAGTEAALGVKTLYEELVTLRAKLLSETTEEQNAELRQKIIDAAQDYAVAHFGATPSGG